MKQVIMIAALAMTMATVAQAKEATGADAQAVNAACATDSATAKCDGEKVGTGLLKCLHAYKKANKDYKFSESCKSAMKTMHADRKAKKNG